MLKNLPEPIIDDLQIKNYDDILSYVSNLEKRFDSLVVTKESLKSFEAESRALGGFARKWDKVRIDRKKEHMEQIAPFEANMQLIHGTLIVTKEKLDRQIGYFEQERKHKRKKEILHEALEKMEILGIEEERFQKEFTIEESWLNKTANPKHVSNYIHQKLLVMQVAQVHEAERIELEIEKNNFAVEYCNQVSEEYSLMHAITINDLSDNFLEYSFTDLRKIITKIAEERQKREHDNINDMHYKNRIFDTFDKEKKPTDYRYAMITLGFGSKEYCFLVQKNIDVLDIVVCDTSKGFTIGTVTRFTTNEEETGYATRWAFQKVIVPAWLRT